MTDPYLRFPSLRGDVVAFVAEDDVWLARLDGGRAWRLTADGAPAADVHLGPDGRHVAYVSRRDGAGEVHVVGTEGDRPRRLTWWGDDRVAVLGWAPDGRVVASSAVGEPFSSRVWARAVPLDGGPAERLPHGPVTGLARGPGGAVVLSTGHGGRRRDYAWWKRYRGGTASRLWVDPDGSGSFERLRPDLDGQLVRPMWVGDRVAFLSDHEGSGNLYSCLPDGSDLRRHTDHDGFWARDAATDGTRVVYVSGGHLHVVDELTADSVPRRVDVRTHGPATGRAPHHPPASRHLGSLSVDRTGRASALEVRGTVHWLTHRDGPVPALADTPGVRARLPRVLGTAAAPAAPRPGGPAQEPPAVVWVSDGTGEDGLEVSTGEGEPRRLVTGGLGRVLELVAAPDGSRLAVASHDGRVLVVDASSGDVRELARSEHDAVTDLAFSPDGAWLAWSHPGPWPLRQIRLAHVPDGAVVDATPLRFTDTDAAFTADGRYLAFLSRRTFDPVYDEHVFDLSFPAGTRPYLLPLAADTASPFDPQRLGRPFAGPPEHGRQGGPDEDAATDGTAPVAQLSVRVDLDGLVDRVVPAPVPAARYRDLRAVADGLVWLREPLHGETGDDLARPGGDAPRPVLERIDLRHGRCTVLAEGVDAVEVSGDGSRLVLRDGEALRVVPADRPVKADEQDPDARVEVDLGRVRLTVDPAAEWRQMLDEAGRLMRENFWVEDMAGVDWDAVLDRYRPLLDRVATRDDLSDVIWETIGELGTSHAYEVPPERPVESSHRLGRLGADLERGDDGRWRVVRVLPGESSAGQARSPLRAPGVGVVEGDVLVAVDGREVDPVTGPGPLLVGAAGVPVELTVEPAAGGGRRRVVVVPLADETALRYQAWVADRRAVVHAATGGRVGYLHVPDMVATGWAQLHRDLRTEVTRDALVVDVRDNRGGHTSQLVIEKLSREVLGWEVARGQRPDTYPMHARRGPLVCLADENAGSDGDIVTAAIKALGLGPVVGMRTWGGVIGIDMRYALVDGTAVSQPKYAFWFDHAGWDVENHGVDPDVEVPFPPQAWATGQDPQLDEALRIVQEALAAAAPSTPPDPATRPSRVPPPLPLRP
ncbi:S41 family peptidase [Thalassiella azotivora]